MTIQQPQATDYLNSPDHALSHRVFANDSAAPVQSIVVDSSGNVGIGLTPTANMTGLSIEGGLVTFKETTTPTADSGYGKIYTKSDNFLYFQDGDGVEHPITETAYGEFKIAENTTATVIRGTNQWQAITANVVTGLQSGFTYNAGLLGEIASTSGTGTVATMNDVGHGLSVGDVISINGTTSYNGVYLVNTVPGVDSFTILHSATSNETGYWQKGATITVGASGAGIYKGTWASCGISATNAHVFDFSPYVNTTRATAATVRRKFSNADYGSFSGTELVTLAVGDIISFMVRNTTATGDVTLRSLDLNLHKID